MGAISTPCKEVDLDQPNNSLEATWDVPRFACDGAFLTVWKARAGESPGASARVR